MEVLCKGLDPKQTKKNELQSCAWGKCPLITFEEYKEDKE